VLLSLSLLAAGVLAAAIAAVQARAAHRGQRAAARAVSRAHDLRREYGVVAEAAAKFAQVEAVTNGVALGTDVVKAVHLGIASVPFSVLEAIPVTRGVSKIVRGVHDAVSHTVYGAIGLANRALGLGLKVGVSAAGDKPEKKDQR
jgi:hypothetical protein